MKNFSLSILVLLFASKLSAQNGVLDVNFNSSGKINSSNETANSITSDKDMKTLVLGHDRSSSTKNIYLTRYNTDGTIDNSFGTSGQFTYDINPDYDYGRCVRALSNGKYLICGQNSAGAYFRAFVLRVNNDGTIDNTFGNNGVLIIKPNNFNCDAWTMEVAPSGSIYLAGYLTTAQVLKSAVWKVKPSGTLDSSFGNLGQVYITTNIYNERLFGIDLDMANNRIALTGISNNVTTPEGLVCLIDTAGNGINAFNGNAVKKIVYGSNPTNLYDVCLKSNEVLVNGNYMSSNGNQKALVVSCLLNGSINTSFANNGYYDDALAELSSFGAGVQDCKGDLFFGGYILYNGYKSPYVCRLNANGSIDQNFASSGQWVGRFNSDADEMIESLAFSSDAGLVAAGRINVGGSGNVGSGILRLVIFQCNSTSIDEVSQTNSQDQVLVLYPNPLKTSSIISLRTELTGDIQYALYSSDGKLVAESVLLSGQTELFSAIGLSAGIYHIVFQNEQLSQQLSFVVE